MFGRDYLETRNQLIEGIRAVRALARRASVEVSEQETGLEDKLRVPFRIVVTGGKGVGKSTFLDKIAGRNLSALAAETSGKSGVRVYRDITYRRNDAYLDECDVVYVERLGEFEFVDASGLQQLDPEQAAALKEIIASADFTYWVLPAENPWAASTWDMLGELHPGNVGGGAIVLQQCDRRADADLQILLGHIRELCIRRVGHDLPFHTVSAIAGTGINQCQHELDIFLTRSYQRRREMKLVYDQAFVLLRRIEETIDLRARTLVDDQQYLRSIEAQIDRDRENTVRDQDATFIQTGNVLKKCIPPVMKFTQSWLNLPRSVISLFGKGDGAFRVEVFLLDHVTQEAETYGLLVGKTMLNKCRESWLAMRPKLADRLAVDVSEFDEKSFEKQLRVFSESMGRSVRQAVIGMKLRRLLDKMVVVRHRRLRRWLMFILASITITGAIGALSHEPLGLVVMSLTSLGLGVIAVAIVDAVRSRNKILREFSEVLLGAVPALVLALRDNYMDRVRAFFNGYTPMFESIHRRMADAILEVTPQQKVAAQLFLRLKAIEQDII